jgi:hypothetical protein
MPLITQPYVYNNGQLIDANQLDANLATLYTAINGNLDGANLKSGINFDSNGMVNVKSAAYNASGSALATTGSITSGSFILTLTAALDFVNGQGISIVGAGAAGATLVTSIANGAGTTQLTLNTAASTTAATQAVNHEDSVALQTAINQVIALGKNEIIMPYGTYRYGVLTSTSGITFIGDGVTLIGTTVLNLTSLVALSADVVQRGINVKNYGAKGDGTTDDYSAIQAAVAALNAAGKGTLIFPPGIYAINQYKIIGGTNVNSIVDVIINNCSNFSIIGWGATISVKGNFNRAADHSSSLSWEESVIPLSFTNCTHFEVCGFELDGNVDLMTRAVGVGEGRCHGIAFYNCSNYSFYDMYIHHFACDGVYVGGSTTLADRQVTMFNIYSTNNARQGMSIIQARHVTSKNCRFEETGNTGAYGVHSPGAGVDIEPGYGTPTVDVLTGFITFENCKFKNNVGPQFTAGDASKVEEVKIINMELISGTSTSVLPFWFQIKNGVVEKSYLDLGSNPCYPTSSNVLQRTTLRDCEIRSSQNLLVSVDNQSLIIDNCRFYNTAVALRTAQVLINIANSKCVFKNNYTFLPAVAYGYGGTTTYDVAIVLSGILLAQNNIYETDMNPAAGQHFCNGYGTTKTAQNEIYLSAGTLISGFRPEVNSLWNNVYPYCTGYGAVGSSMIMTNIDHPEHYNNRIVFVRAIPATGSYRLGDIAFLSQPAKAGKVGWVRLTTGSAHVLNTDWQPFGAIDA